MKSKQKTQWVERLTRDQMIDVVGQLLNPKGLGFTQEQLIYKLNLFCSNCPDPVGAMDIALEESSPTTAQKIVDKALSLPPRDPAFTPFAKIAASHPLRFMRPR